MSKPFSVVLMNHEGTEVHAFGTIRSEIFKDCAILKRKEQLYVFNRIDRESKCIFREITQPYIITEW